MSAAADKRFPVWHQPDGSPALFIERISYLPDGRIIEFTRSHYRGDSYDFDPKLGNTATSTGLGLYRLIINIRMLSSLDSIVIQVTIGETVVTAQSLLAAA